MALRSVDSFDGARRKAFTTCVRPVIAL